MTSTQLPEFLAKLDSLYEIHGVDSPSRVYNQKYRDLVANVHGHSPAWCEWKHDTRTRKLLRRECHIHDLSRSLRVAQSNLAGERFRVPR
jgi:hypothetical protein